jgi:vacuolar-type H+-ATPase subunit I/STV1
MSKLEATCNTVLDFIIQTKGMCKELTSEAASICQSHLLLMEQSLSRVHRTRVIISQVTRSKENDSKSERSKRGVFNFVGSSSKILFGTLSDEDATYYKNKISELHSEQISVLKVAKEQMMVVRSSLQTVNFTLADVAANEIQLSENLNIMHKHITENGGKKNKSGFFASYSFNCS